MYELAVTCGIIEVKMGAYLWGGKIGERSWIEKL